MSNQITNPQREMESDIRIMVRGIYAIQKLRIQMGNRLVANFKVKLGIKPSEKESTVDKEGEKLLGQLKRDYALIADGVARNLPTARAFKGQGTICEYTDLLLMDQYMEMEYSEKIHFKQLEYPLQEYKIWTEFLSNTAPGGGVHGVGPAIAGVLISEIDITKCEYPSSMWKYAGLDVCTDGAGRSRRKEHLEEVAYIDKEGKDAVRNSITYNPFLKTKLTGVLGTSFLRQPVDKCVYRRIYYEYKNRLENNPRHEDKTKLHIHNMSTRYAIKRFLVDLYKAWRSLEGLPVAEEYAVAKLGLTHKKAQDGQ